MRRMGVWKEGRWYRIMRAHTLWIETSDEAEARAAMEKGDILERLWVKEDYEWRKQS